MFRPIRSSLLAALLITATSATAQLNGTYTIGTAGNYTTFTAAVTALTTSGVSGPVVFNVFSGTYNEQVSIGAIAGASAANTILFRSQGLDNTLVTLDHPSQANNTNDYLLQLNGCDHITFQHITLQRSGALDYARIVNVLTGSTDWHFLNDRFISSTSTSTTGLREMIAIAGPAIGASSVEDCTMTNGMGPYLSFVSSGTFTMSRNSLTNVLRGLNLLSCSNGTFLVEDNVVTTRATGATRGAMFDFCSGSITVRRNTFTGASNLFSGLLFNTTSGTVGTPVKVEGNVIIGTTTALNGISVMSGICSYIDISNNSVSMSGAGGQAMVVLLGSGTSIRIRNNIFRSAGYTLRVDPASRVSASDNNVLHSLAGNSVQWGPSWYATIAALNAATGMNGNSMMTEPQFVDPLTDLHLQGTSPCLGAGQVIAGMGADLDGDARPLPALSNPEIGADETTAQCAALSGAYIIGPSVAADHPTFNSAANAMISCGIAGPVLFLVESGTYTEQITLPQIAGTSATNTITFRSQAMDSSAVLLRWASGTPNNYVVRFNGADHVSFDRITMERTGGPVGAEVVLFEPPGPLNDSRSITITHCRLISDGSFAASSALVNKFASTVPGVDSLKIEHTRLIGGGIGVTANIGVNDRVLLQDNRFMGQNLSAVIVLSASASFTLRRNSASHAPMAYNHAVMISNASAGFTIEANRFSNTNGTAIGLSNTNTSLGGTSFVRNNMLRGSTYGLWTIGSTSGLRVDHNSMYGGVSGLYFFSSGPVNIASLRNNVLQGGLYGLQRDAAVTVTFAQTSHNALFSPTGDVANSGGTMVGTIAALQALTGQFANSIEIDPKYFDQATCDLHAYVMELDAAGTPLLAVTSDFDGQVRNTTTPDIGADEFTPQLWNDAFNTCSLADVIVSTGSGTDQWIYKDRKVVARLNDNGRVLGNVGLSFYVNSGPVRTSDMGQRYLDRNWRLAAQNTWTGSILLRVFFSGNEFTAYAAADPLVTTQADAGLTHYIGVNENCSETDNPIGQTWLSYYPVPNGSEPRINAAGGTGWATAVLAQDGEIYMSGLGQVLPVELLSFSGERTNERLVQLKWTTATEHNNAGFEVWRMIEGEDGFTNVAWVDGAGESQTLVNYALPDDNATSRTSYYRLKQVDNDGQFAWSPVVAVAGASAPAPIVLWPNPAHGTFQVMPDQGGVLSVRLLTMNSGPVRQWSYEGPYNLDGITAGTYLVRIERSDGSLEHKRLVVE